MRSNLPVAPHWVEVIEVAGEWKLPPYEIDKSRSKLVWYIRAVEYMIARNKAQKKHG